MLGNIVKNQELGQYTIALFLDLSKAFDTLKHEILLNKLEIYSIRGVCLDWYRSYLCNRNIQVKCKVDITGNVEYSDTYQIEYGTLQSSCLGPLLFLIFCNDINLHLDYMNVLQFADDTTLYLGNKKSKIPAMVCRMQCQANHGLVQSQQIDTESLQNNLFGL